MNEKIDLLKFQSEITEKMTSLIFLKLIQYIPGTDRKKYISLALGHLSLWGSLPHASTLVLVS